MYDQLDIYSEEIKDKPDMIHLHDIVKTRKPADSDDVETYYYLQDYQGRKGIAVKMISEYPKQYEVEFEGFSRNGIFNESELLLSE